MGLRCLLGHNFGEPEVERDREEDGNEVVITVREVKKCTRCGDQQIVSENKEVTSLDQLTDEAAVAEERAEAERAGAEQAGAGQAEAERAGAEQAGAEQAGAERDAETADSEPVTADATDPATEGTIVEDAEGDVVADTGDAGAVDAGDAGDVDAGGEPPVDGAGAEIIDDGPATDAPSEPDPTVDLSEAAEGGDPTEPAPTTEDGHVPAEGEGDAEIIEETAAAETGVDETADPETVADEVPGGSEAEPETDPAEDDGVILDDDVAAEPADRDPGEWPDVEPEQSGTGDHSPWPEQRGEDEGFDAAVDDETDAEVSFGGGLKPEPADDPDVDEETEFIETPEETEGGFIATAEESAPVEGSTPEPDADASNAAGGDRGTGGDQSPGSDRGTGGDRGAGRPGTLGAASTEQLSEYYCPECGLAEIAGDSSMRAGDICPECKRGYVAERPAE